KSQPEPSMSLIGAIVVQHFDRIGECEKTGIFNSMRKSLGQEYILVVKHLHEAILTDISLADAVDGITELHVICGYGLGDGSGSASYLEKTGGHLLAGPNFRE